MITEEQLMAARLKFYENELELQALFDDLGISRDDRVKVVMLANKSFELGVEGRDLERRYDEQEYWGRVRNEG